MSEQYRLTITWRKTRPTYSLYHRRHNLSQKDEVEYWPEDLAEVGQVFTAVIGPYDKLQTLKSQRSRLLKNYPFKYVHQPDDALAKEGWPDPGYEILDERLEMGVVRTDWIELDKPW